MNKKISHILLAIGLLAGIAQNTSAQVTIGSAVKPANGSILQLKENNGVNENSNRGLGMPRVELTKKDFLYPMLKGVADYDDLSKKDDYDAAHTGLIVYNITSDPRPECAEIPNGLYVWDGLEWQPLTKRPTGTFPTLENFDASTGVLTDRSGFEYYTGQFGTAGRWMTQNLRTTHAPSCNEQIVIYEGTPSLTERQYHYPGTKGGEKKAPTTWRPKQGLLYNWCAAVNGLTPASELQAQHEPNEVENLAGAGKKGVIQGICPDGWHLPSDREWNELEKAVTVDGTNYSTIAAGDIKPWEDIWATDYKGSFRGSMGLILKSPNKVEMDVEPVNTLGLSNPYDNADMPKRGFEALLTGTLSGNEQSNYGKYGYFWSSSATKGKNGESNFAMHRYIVGDDPNINKLDDKNGVFRISLDRTLLISIRCKQNESNDVVLDHN